MAKNANIKKEKTGFGSLKFMMQIAVLKWLHSVGLVPFIAKLSV